MAAFRLCRAFSVSSFIPQNYPNSRHSKSGRDVIPR
jgi:hypothetical protein